jgi:hypothetical protein
MGYLQRLAVIVLLAALLPISTAFSEDDGTSLLTSLLGPDHAIENYPWEDKIVSTAFLMGEKAIPILEKSLSHRDEDKAFSAGRALAVIGGDRAVAVLRKKYEETGAIWIKSMLCFALGSTGKPEDVKYLLRSIEGDDMSDEEVSIQSAAYSLGVLRAEEARGDLHRIMEKNSDTFPSEAARMALQWMDREPWQTPQAVTAEGKDEVILALFRFGIPRTDEADAFVEKKAHRVWRRHDKSWSYRDCSGVTEKMPCIGFAVWMSTDGARALCSVGLVFDRLNASDYDFVLKKVEGEWRVVGVNLTGVS